MSAADQHPSLRLVGGNVDDVPPPTAEDPISQLPVAPPAESNLDAGDPRWVLAAHVTHQLQGSILTPDRRARIVRLARQLGIRPFEANLIIAIVQDHARSGRSLSDAQPVLALLNRPERPGVVQRWAHFVAAFLCAVVATSLAIWWIVN